MLVSANAYGEKKSEHALKFCLWIEISVLHLLTYRFERVLPDDN